MSNPRFPNYVSPNIVIVPTVSFCGPPIKRQKPNADCQPARQAIPVAPVENNNSPCATISVKCKPMTQTCPVPLFPVENNNSLYASIIPMENISNEIKFPIENNTNSMPTQDNKLIPSYDEDPTSNHLEDSELRVKKTLSWASTYLQSIGQSQPKVLKLSSSTQQKFVSKTEECQISNKMKSAEQNTYKNKFKPTVRNSLQQSSHIKSTRNIAPMQSSSATTANRNSHDTKHPIKINLLYHKQYTDTYGDKVNHLNINNSNTQIFIKPNSGKSADYISSDYYLKSRNQSNMDSNKYAKDSKTHFEKNTHCIPAPSPSKSGEINNMDEGKDIKNTNSINTPNKNVSLQGYPNISNDRNKESKESNLLIKNKNDKCSSKQPYNSKVGLEALTSNKIKKSLSNKTLCFHSKDVLEASSSNRIKTNSSDRPAHTHSYKSRSNHRSESNNEKIKLQSRESTAKKTNVNDDKKIKSKRTKCKDDGHKNISKSSTKSNENSNNKKSEHSIPIKSVVQVTNNYDFDSPYKTAPENCHSVEDLRTKLKRKYQNTQSTKRDNLIITVQNDNNNKIDIDSQPKAERKPKSEKKAKKYKKIKLIINVVCEKCSESSESDSDIINKEEYSLANVDLSFLNDFNIDDIVESLNDQEDKVNVNISPSKDLKNITEHNYHIIKDENSKENESSNLIKDEKTKEKECSNLIKDENNKEKECSNLIKDEDNKGKECYNLIKDENNKENECSNLIKDENNKEKECSNLIKDENNKEKECFNLIKDEDNKGKECSNLIKDEDNKGKECYNLIKDENNNENECSNLIKDENNKEKECSNLIKDENNKEKECFNLITDGNNKECSNIQNRFYTESSQHEIDLKQKINALKVIENNNIENYRSSQITSNAIRASNNILDPAQNKIENTELGEKLNTVLVPYSPNKLKTKQNKTNDLFNSEITSDICFSNMDEKIEKVFQLQNNNTDKELSDSKLHKESNIGIKNITSENETQIETKDDVIIDLTLTKTGMPHEVKITSTNLDTVNTQLLKQAHAKRKTRENSEVSAIIDLTVSTENTAVIKKGVATSIIHTPAQQQLKIKETSTKYNIEKQSLVKTTKIKNNKEDEPIIKVPLRPQHETKVTVTETDIIDLTLPTEFTSGIKNEAIETLDVTIQTQQPAAIENLAEDNIHSQSITTLSEIKYNVNITPAKYEVNKSLSNNTAMKNYTKVELDFVNVQTTEVAAEPWQHNQISLIAEIDNITQNGPVVNNISNGQTSKIAPGLQQLKAKESYFNNSIDINTQSIEIESAKSKNIISMAYNLACQQADSSKKPTTKQEQARTVKETNLGEDCDHVLSVTDNLDEILTNYNLVTNIDSEKEPIYSPTSFIKTQVVFDTKEEAKTEAITCIPESKATETKNENKSDTDTNKEKSDSAVNANFFCPTSSIKTQVVFDTKEEAKTEAIKFMPESKSTKTKIEGKSDTDTNKEKSDSAVNAKLNYKQNEQLSVLETRMCRYLGARYSIESLISHGKFSKIFLCKDDNGRNYALKVLNKGNRLRGCRIEDMLKDLQKDIPRQNYHCVFLVDGFAMLDQWCLLMDYYPRNMQEVLYENGKSFHVDVVQTLARQLVSAVLILRNNNIMHLDIKPSHILMNTTNDRLKLAGFDESQYLEGLSVLPCIGTVNYRPPEVILGFPYFGKIDVWSTALVIYEMCTARQLFPGYYNNDILYKQLCTLGNIPFEMMIQSVFTNKHYRGAYFARRYGPAWQQCVLIDTFKKSIRIATSLFEAYERDWAEFRTRRQKTDDSTKLRIVRDLLEQMLVLDPTHRTPIEFVYVNSFIYEKFDTCI